MRSPIIAVSLAIGLSNLSGLGAQSTTETTTSVSSPAASESTAAVTVATPESVTLTPSVASGVRTASKGNLAGGAGESTVGPFVRPAASLTFKNSKIMAALNYELEVSGGEGLGANKKSITENAYFQHNPVVVISGGLLPNWKLNGVLDMKWKYANQDRAESVAEVFANPDIQYNITPSISIAAGYVLHRVEKIEADPIGEADSVKSFNATAKKSVAVSANEKPTTLLHAGILTNKIDLGSGNKLTTYVRGGKKSSNQEGKTAYSYRFQTHLDFATALPELTGALRYRFNIDDVKNKDVYNYYNLALVELNYAVTANWSINVKNEFVALQSTAASVKANFENENYIGATFAF